jgi:hypothetical protein
MTRRRWFVTSVPAMAWRRARLAARGKALTVSTQLGGLTCSSTTPLQNSE